MTHPIISGHPVLSINTNSNTFYMKHVTDHRVILLNDADMYILCIIVHILVPYICWCCTDIYLTQSVCENCAVNTSLFVRVLGRVDSEVILRPFTPIYQQSKRNSFTLDTNLLLPSLTTIRSLLPLVRSSELSRSIHIPFENSVSMISRAMF